MSADAAFVVALLRRLIGRAETAERNARTYAAAGYAGEALRQHERAAAYRLAAEDVTEIATTDRAAALPYGDDGGRL